MADDLIRRKDVLKLITDRYECPDICVKEISKIPAVPYDGWISVKKELPKWLEDVLCCVVIPEDKGDYRVNYRVLHITDLNSSLWNCTGIIVTHWQPLSPLPDISLT